MLETFTLKSEHAKLRLELSNALYEKDAAKRVIARLIKERDEARSALEQGRLVDANGHSVTAASGTDNTMDVDQAPAQEQEEEEQGMAKVVGEMVRQAEEYAHLYFVYNVKKL
jgi:ribosomal 50S subunit-recycling heat shock protein